MTQIFVCIKQALDWNASTKDFRIDPQTHEVVVSFARYRIDQFDEIALEVGLQCRDRVGGELRALTVGSEDADDVLRHAFAMKADHGTLVERSDSATATPALLAAAVRHYGGGIVLCGRTSSGSGTGQTGPAMAEMLRVPFVANAVHIEGEENEWLCRCETAHGYEVLKVTGPFVATITNAETNLPRVASMKDVMRAHRTNFDTLDGDSLAAAAGTQYAQRTRVLRRYIPTNSRACNRIAGAPNEQAKVLAQYIRTVSTPV